MTVSIYLFISLNVTFSLYSARHYGIVIECVRVCKLYYYNIIIIFIHLFICYYLLYMTRERRQSGTFVSLPLSS